MPRLNQYATHLFSTISPSRICPSHRSEAVAGVERLNGLQIASMTAGLLGGEKPHVCHCSSENWFGSNWSMDWFKGQFYRKPWFLPSNVGVSCKLSHHPILWNWTSSTFSGPGWLSEGNLWLALVGQPWITMDNPVVCMTLSPWIKCQAYRKKKDHPYKNVTTSPSFSDQVSVKDHMFSWKKFDLKNHQVPSAGLRRLEIDAWCSGPTLICQPQGECGSRRWKEQSWLHWRLYGNSIGTWDLDGIYISMHIYIYVCVYIYI